MVRSSQRSDASVSNSVRQFYAFSAAGAACQRNAAPRATPATGGKMDEVRSEKERGKEEGNGAAVVVSVQNNVENGRRPARPVDMPSRHIR